MERILLSLEEVIRRTSLKKSKLYTLMKQGLFPKNFPLAGSKRKVWDSIAVQNFIDAQVAKAAQTERNEK